MSDKSKFSFTRAINSLIKRNCLLDAEAIFDNEIRRRVESTETLRQLSGSIMPNDLRFYAPVISALSRRSIDTGGSGAGVVAREDIGPFSDLLQWSATIRQGAELLTNVQGDLSTEPNDLFDSCLVRIRTLKGGQILQGLILNPGDIVYVPFANVRLAGGDGFYCEDEPPRDACFMIFLDEFAPAPKSAKLATP
jgi:hypothetical protein